MRYFVAIAVSLASIVALFVFSWAMHAEMLRAAELGRDLSLTDRVLMNLGNFWRHFWLPLSVMIVAGASLIAAILPKRKATSPPGAPPGPIG